MVWNVSSSIQNWCLRFFLHSRKVNSCFCICCFVVACCSLFLALSHTDLSLFVTSSSSFPRGVAIVSSARFANLCRRRSVAFVHPVHPESRKMHFSTVLPRAFFECDAHACLEFGVRARAWDVATRAGGVTGSVVLIWDQRGRWTR